MLFRGYLKYLNSHYPHTHRGPHPEMPISARTSPHVHSSIDRVQSGLFCPTALYTILRPLMASVTHSIRLSVTIEKWTSIEGLGLADPAIEHTMFDTTTTLRHQLVFRK